MKPRLLPLAVLALLPVARAETWSEHVVPFLGRPLVVQVPANYQPVPRGSPRREAFAEWLDSQKLTMAAWFVADDYHSVIIEDYGPSRGYVYNPVHWAEDVKRLRDGTAHHNPADLAARLANPANSPLKLPAYARLGMPLLLPVYDESPRHYSCRMVQTLVGEGSKPRIEVSSYSQVYVSGRLVTLSVNATYPSRSPYGSLEDFTKEIIRRLLAANPD